MTIELKRVSKRFGDLIVLDGVNFDVRTGETVCLLGPSAWKERPAQAHQRADRAGLGDVFVDDLHVNTLSRRELAKLRTRIGYVFQYGALFDSMERGGNITLGITDEDMSADVLRMSTSACGLPSKW